MPVDFSRLPPVEELPGKPPSPLFWGAVFIILMLLGAASVLLLWPQEEPIQTPWFWICLTVYPIGISSLVVLRRYSVHEGRCLDAIAWNQARDQYVERLFDVARRPLCVLASNYIFSADEENDIAGLLSGSLFLNTQRLPTPDTAPMKARWLVPAAGMENAGLRRDGQRQEQLITWLFQQIVSSMAESIRSLPMTVPLEVHLHLCGSALPADVLRQWQRCWEKHALTAAEMTKTIVQTDLMSLDTWLDQLVVNEANTARLMVFVELNDLLQKAPPVCGAEAGVVFLLAPLDVVTRHRLRPLAHVHRPMSGQCEVAADVLEYALKWSKAKPSDVVRMWKTGMDIAQSSVLTTALVKAGMKPLSIDVDMCVGNAASAAPWLALACALAAAQKEAGVQLVAFGQKENLQLVCCRTAVDIPQA